jgi:hypothetical protein
MNLTKAHVACGIVIVVGVIIAVVGGHAAAPIERKLTLTRADILTALADYRIVYDASPSFCASYAGLTDPFKRTITLCETMDLRWRRSTLIHELLHAKSALWESKDSQYQHGEIEPAVERLYEEIFK